MASGSPRIVIIGAGPTGLGAAWRLEELRHADWHLYEASLQPGGLAASVLDAQGFTWDYGCHAFHSHYAYVDRLLDVLLGTERIEHRRQAWAWLCGRWLPYPLQNHFGQLPKPVVARCLEGLLAALQNGTDPAARAASGTQLQSLDEWLLQSFGSGLCDVFLKPYNRKVWGYAPERLGAGWIADRVAPVDARRVAHSVVFREDGDLDWGPNAMFAFPMRGGTGAIWRALAARLPSDRMTFGRAVRQVDVRRHRIQLEGGEEVAYDGLISTMPLDLLIALTPDLPQREALQRRFVHTSTHVIGLGFEGPLPTAAAGRSWLYCPEPDVPFHRVSVYSNYSPFNVPRPGRQWSLLAEVSESSERSVDAGGILSETLAGLVSCGLTDGRSRVVSRFHRRLEYGYPTPWLGRDEVLRCANELLEHHGVLSRGRFGSWKYEVSNMDHSVMQGAEAAERLVRGGSEPTYHGRMLDSLDPEAECTLGRGHEHEADPPHARRAPQLESISDMTGNTPVELAIIMPAHNEAASIGRVVREWWVELECWTADFQLLVIDDGSTDATPEVLACLAAELGPRLIGWRQSQCGHGRSCLAGYRWAAQAGAAHVLQIDSDGQCDPQHFGKIWALRHQAPVVYGERVRRDDGMIRVLASTLLRHVVRLAAGTRCIDANVPYRVMRTSVIAAFLARVPEEFDLGNVALAVLLERAGVPSLSVPIRFRRRYGGEPSVRPTALLGKGVRLARQLRRLARGSDREPLVSAADLPPVRPA